MGKHDSRDKKKSKPRKASTAILVMTISQLIYKIKIYNSNPCVIQKLNNELR
jgi:hypothetical protein